MRVVVLVGIVVCGGVDNEFGFFVYEECFNLFGM